jgi:hypothetical protein
MCSWRLSLYLPFLYSFSHSSFDKKKWVYMCYVGMI